MLDSKEDIWNTSDTWPEAANNSTESPKAILCKTDVDGLISNGFTGATLRNKSFADSVGLSI
jgi:hypothetical protein